MNKGLILVMLRDLSIQGLRVEIHILAVVVQEAGFKTSLVLTFGIKSLFGGIIVTFAKVGEEPQNTALAILLIGSSRSSATC